MYTSPTEVMACDLLGTMSLPQASVDYCFMMIRVEFDPSINWMYKKVKSDNSVRNLTYFVLCDDNPT